MTDQPTPTDHAARVHALDQEFAQFRAHSDSRLVRAELKTEAIRLGIVDLACLQFVDSTNLKLNEDGNLPEAAAVLARLKRDKPWAFSQPNSSHPAPPPAPEPPQLKMAKDMTVQEWRAARDKLVKRQSV
jgi:hypothetical protein